MGRATGPARPTTASGRTGEPPSSAERECDDRPFVGGVDTAHTLLYFAKFGPALIPDDPSGEPRIQLTRVAQREIPFRSIEDFANFVAVRDRYFLLQRHNGATSASMDAWLGESGQDRPGATRAVITPSGLVFSLRAEECLPADRLRDLLTLTARIRGDA